MKACMCKLPMISVPGVQRQEQRSSEIRTSRELLFIEDAGHMIWVENPVKAKEAFEKMIPRLK